MNIHSILLIVQQPDAAETYSATGSWRNFAANCPQKQLTAEQGQKLGAYSWLLRAENGLPILAEIVIVAQQFEIPYRVHFFAEEPQWLGTWQ